MLATRALIFASLTFPWAFGNATVPVYASARFKATSINIRFDTATEPGAPSDGINAWELRKEFLAESVSGNMPTVIGTQEGRQKQLKSLEELLKRRNAAYVVVDGHRSQPWPDMFFPSLFIDSEQAAVIKSGDLWLSDTPDDVGSKLSGSKYPRLLTWALLQYRLCSSPRLIYVVNAHVDASKSPEVRSRQVEIVLNLIDKRIWDHSSPLVLMGDFNEGPADEARKQVIDSALGLTDPWISLGFTEKASFNNFNNLNGKAGGRIDWILTTPGFSFPWILIDETSRLNPSDNTKIQFPSDHNPVKFEASVCSP